MRSSAPTGNSVVFDLHGVTFIDSAGIGTVVRGMIKLKKLGGTLRLARSKGHGRRAC